MRLPFAVGFSVLLAFGLSGCPGPAPVTSSPNSAESEPHEISPVATPPPAAPTPPPPPYVPSKRIEVGKIFNSLQLRTSFETEIGKSATAERGNPGSYAVDVQVKVRVPQPHKDLAEISALNSQLPAILPDLAAMLPAAKVSPAFDELYRLKCAAVRASLNRLDALLSRHNFFDCETILEIQHPKTQRRALFVQADMDVDTDGSDSDRVPQIDAVSSTFQPFTSYRWAKKTETPNPFVTPREARLKQYELELATGSPSAARRVEVNRAQANLRSEIADLKTFSFLVGGTDPFIVLPGPMFSKARMGSFTPAVGDYCVVVYERTLYPAIVGDAGPTNIVGEASLRLCKQLNQRANPENRPVNDLKVSYLVFPGTADRPFQAPDLAKWRTRCEKLIEEIGGHRGELFAWEDLTKPKLPPDFIGPPAP